jgi:hypothetical protein
MSDHVTNWQVAHPDFGGFSAIELTADGRSFLALTDRGIVFAGVLDRFADGWIASVQAQPPIALSDENGRSLHEDRNDTEGLALGSDGGFLVSLEGPAEVVEYAKLGAVARSLPRMPAWKLLGANAGFEALAVDPSGGVLVLPEPAQDNFYASQEYRAAHWVAGRPIRASNGFSAVGADFGPDGRLYLLERQFAFPGGFAARLRRFSKDSPDGEVVWSSPLGRHGNLEGLSVWMDPAHGLTATMISDDNFLSLLQTDLIEIKITD